MKKKIFLFSILFFVLGINTANAEEVFNAGFVGGIWFSEQPFFAGEDIRIYAAIQNQSGLDIYGKIIFFGNDVEIGRKDFNAIDGRLVESWSDWKVIAGEHDFRIELIEVFASRPGEEPEKITLISSSSEKKSQFADFDTDGDKIGNKEDLDDDNDGLTDQEEEEIGTDPLDSDTDSDGLSDNEEVKNGTNPLIDETIVQETSNSANEESKDVDFSINSGTEVIEKVSDQIPDKAKEVSSGIIQRINNGADFIKEKIDESRDKKKLELTKLKEDTNDDSETKKSLTKEQVFKSINIFLLGILSFILGNKFVLYVVLLLILFLLLRIFWKIGRR